MPKFSILIGIDNYPQYKNNYGCKNDVELFSHLLQEQNHEITTLINENATKEKILQSLEETVNKSNDQDFINIYFAGSGSFLVAGEGKIKEIICPFDFDFNNNYISLDRLKNVFDGIHNAIKVQFIFDCAFFSSIDYLQQHSSNIITIGRFIIHLYPKIYIDLRSPTKMYSIPSITKYMS